VEHEVNDSALPDSTQITNLHSKKGNILREESSSRRKEKRESTRQQQGYTSQG
jgi:hypothetical protein